MRRDQITELHFITPLANIASICQRGILCNRHAERHRHDSVAMAEIQERREKKVVPGGKPLHEYANLYFHARNPMLFKRKAQHAELCVLRIDLAVLDLPGVVITSQNASSDYARFYPSPQGLVHLNYDQVFAEYWTHPNDPIAEWQHKSIKCAEVLVPGKVDPQFIKGAYVSNAETQTIFAQQLRAENVIWDIIIDRHLFFLGGRP
jgi:hypothetical protein